MSDRSDLRPGELTALLQSWHGGNRDALDAVMPLVYEELRLLASRHLSDERRDHTLQTTALVHEAYLRLAGQHRAEWKDRAYFFGAVATIMRRILVDHARRRARDKRGGGMVVLSLDQAPEPIADTATDASVDVEALDRALDRLHALDARQARIVELRYFSGMTLDEIAKALGVSIGTVKRDWTAARAWLFTELGPGAGSASTGQG
jgi:RNA polymerase sigma factor (TIGR02999 family)